MYQLKCTCWPYLHPTVVIALVQGWIDKALFDRIVAIMAKAKLPTRPPPEMTAAQFRSLMAVDKKVWAQSASLYSQSVDQLEVHRMSGCICSPPIPPP